MIMAAIQAGQTDLASELIGNYLKKEREGNKQFSGVKSSNV